GPPRKYYEITQEGLEVLSRLDVTWNELVFAVNTSLVGRNNDSTKPVKDNNDE
nr:PadR family transcriptional regulator [Sphingobacterium sp.]